MKKIALTDRSQELIKNYLLGGAAAGGSAALLTSLANYLNMLKTDAEKDPATEDDDTLYVNMPTKPKVASQAPGKLDWSAGGLALTGGLLSTVGSYALIRKAYQSMKRKQLQEELDAAQQTYLGDIEQEGEQAKMGAAVAPPTGKPMGIGEFLTSAPVAFTLLSAIAAGALSNVALNKTFPSIKKPVSAAPKRVVLRRGDDPNAEEEEIDPSKVASYEDGVELVANLVMNSKSAHISEIPDIVAAVASGRHDEFTHNVLELGLDTAMATIKGAAESTQLTPQQRQLAIGLCAKSAALGPVFATLVAAEYMDMAPKFSKIASLQSPEDLDTLAKIASVIGVLGRHETFHKHPVQVEFTKSANANMATIAAILSLLNSKQQGNPEDQGIMGDPQDDRNEQLQENTDMSTEDSISSSEEKEVNDLHPGHNQHATPAIIDELGDEDDLIDEAMSRPTTPAKAVAAENK